MVHKDNDEISKLVHQILELIKKNRIEMQEMKSKILNSQLLMDELVFRIELLESKQRG